MADKTGIEWTDATWNPVPGCAKVSAGCKTGDDTAAYKRRQTRKRIDYDTNAYHNEAWTSNPPFKRSPRPE